MKKYISIILASALAFILAGCVKESAGVTRITYYPTLTLEGDEVVLLNIGETYTEPGFSAVMNGEDVTAQVTVTSNVDNTATGLYTVKYSIINADGIEASSSRSVWVLNPGGIDNVYSSHAWMGSRNYTNLAPISIQLYAPGIYYIDDFCGGFYCFGRYPGYEPTYNFHAGTYFTLGATGAISVLGADDWYFVNSFDYTNVTGTGYNATDGTFSYNFDGLNVQLTPITK